eukprot:CAMPEP_0172452182 /NCGR_PEP_ID=MMETSP1065-20121228/9926_1 /TAXON_ID=265537 /ORGANISM="Amphiprora paludosa, Strain CCMP125" /LENGTH=66 /DNA_ID=CAMNT_0013204207 /DNA_START=81 /DNA_END=281 /DNA_ORIENTATION=-
MTAPVTTYWRIAGLSYLQYVNRAASSVRTVLKEPAKRKALLQNNYYYKSAVWENGKQGAKTEVGAL